MANPYSPRSAQTVGFERAKVIPHLHLHDTLIVFVYQISGFTRHKGVKPQALAKAGV